jgi:hypothetical protein
VPPTLSPTRATTARGGPLYPHAGWYFLAALLLTVAGFFPSYFGRLRQTDGVHHFHGIAATLWMLLLVVQGFLASTPRRWRLHRSLGWASVLIAPALLISGAWVVRVMLQGATPFNRVFGPRLAFLDVTTLAYFATAYSLALVYRRDQALHGRYLASTALLALPPGLARLFVHALGLGFVPAVHAAYAACGVAIAALLWDDHIKGGIRVPYLLLGAVMSLQEVGFIVIPHLR